MKDSVELNIQPGDKGYNQKFDTVLVKMGNLSSIELVNEEVKGAASFRVFSSSFFISLGEMIDVEEELKKLEEELKYTEGFLNSVIKKLSNERFVSSAPEAVVSKERIKQADAEAKIKILQEQIANLK
jgi:valyl-tRNA synthetase